MNAERGARLLATGLLLGVLLALGAAALLARADGVIEIHGRVAESGGWTPGDLQLRVGQTARLRLVSDDVVHGFAIGQQAEPDVELLPGRMAETTLRFDQPGTYTYYCTRWCGPNHWRMRGTIEVLPAAGQPAPVETVVAPLYVQLGLNIDAPHPAAVTPAGPPSAARGARLRASVPAAYLASDYYRSHSPAQVWQALRAEPELTAASDAAVWDLVAFVWARNVTPAALAEGARLYAANCAACHGETGRGDSVGAAPTATPDAAHAAGHGLQAPVDFTDPGQLLGASPALLYGKIVRGGMGTGMPYWGPIFTDEQVWALVAQVFSYQFQMEEQP